MVINRFAQFATARKYGYRSGLEIKISDLLKEQRVKFKYEPFKIEWEDLAYRTYTPDFVLFNGFIRHGSLAFNRIFKVLVQCQFSRMIH